MCLCSSAIFLSSPLPNSSAGAVCRGDGREDGDGGEDGREEEKGKGGGKEDGMYCLVRRCCLLVQDHTVPFVTRIS